MQDWYRRRRRRDRRRALAQEHPRLRLGPRRAFPRLRAGRRHDSGRQPGAGIPEQSALPTSFQFTEIAPTIVSMHTAMSATASPNGWINDCPGGVCTANETQTLGNNVLACLDRAAYCQRLRHGRQQRARRQRPADRQPGRQQPQPRLPRHRAARLPDRLPAAPAGRQPRGRPVGDQCRGQRRLRPTTASAAAPSPVSSTSPTGITTSSSTSASTRLRPTSS